MASSRNLSIPTEQDNPAFDRVFAELGFSSQFPFTFEGRPIDDEPEEQDRTDWEDFLSYHAGVRL